MPTLTHTSSLAFEVGIRDINRATASRQPAGGLRPEPARAVSALTGAHQAQSLLPILREIDLRVDLDEALALRRVGRPRRSERSRKGWRTRRAGA